MIFVTVGSQLSFDRLIITIDSWAKNNKKNPVFAQIGMSEYKPKNIGFCKTMSPDEYDADFDKADLIIAHAGMGTIISALEYGKPLIILPRLSSKGEHRNDHQLSTAKYFSHYNNIYVVNNEDELLKIINKLVNREEIFAKQELAEVSSNLISIVKKFANE